MEEKYGGGPCELLLTEPSTYRQLIQYYYFLIHVSPTTDFWVVVQQISKDLKSIWSSMNPRLPLIGDKSIDRKVKNLLTLVKDINRNHGKASAKRNLDANLNKLFDISACSCSLDTLPCSDISVNCENDKRTQEHIICVCPRNAKVPLEDRVYLRDQRSKTGPKGAYQLSSVDTAAAKRDRRAKHEQQQVLTHEEVELAGPSIHPTESPEHTSNSSNGEVNFL